MSIYATLWTLQFPRRGHAVPGCDWTRVRAQGVPAHIGSPTPGLGYEDGDPYGAFLPPPLDTTAQGEHEFMRAVVFVTEETSKGTDRSPQEYADPLLVLTGEAYAALSFGALHRRLCNALRGETACPPIQRWQERRCHTVCAQSSYRFCTIGDGLP
mgnify:CR=1 FL=1